MERARPFPSASLPSPELTIPVIAGCGHSPVCSAVVNSMLYCCSLCTCVLCHLLLSSPWLWIAVHFSFFCSMNSSSCRSEWTDFCCSQCFWGCVHLFLFFNPIVMKPSILYTVLLVACARELNYMLLLFLRDGVARYVRTLTMFINPLGVSSLVVMIPVGITTTKTAEG